MHVDDESPPKFLFTELLTGTVSKDLFFSCHTATLSLMALTATKLIARRIFATVAGLVSAALVIQHVHYSVDILAAVPVSYLAFRAVDARSAARHESAT